MNTGKKSAGVVVSFVPFKVTYLANWIHPAQIWLISFTTQFSEQFPLFFQLQSIVFLWWMKPTVNYTSSSFNWDHFVWDRQLSCTNLPRHCRKRKVLRAVGEIPLFWKTLVFAALYISNLLPADPSVEIPEYLQEKPGPPSRKLKAAGGLPTNMETFSDLLAMDMSKLAVHGGCQSNKNQESAENVPPLRSLEPSRWPGGSGASRPTLPAGVWIIPDPKFHLFSKYCHCPHVQPADAGDKHGRRLHESGRRDTDVRRDAEFSHLRFLQRGFSRRHQHQRRLSTPPLLPHHLKYTRWRPDERVHRTLWHRLRQESLQQRPSFSLLLLMFFFFVFVFYSWYWHQQKRPWFIFAIIFWVFVFVVLTALGGKNSTVYFFYGTKEKHHISYCPFGQN